jgi:hypothetical protein
MEKNKFKIYLINLYNTGSYDPLPCYLQSKQNIYDSHPFIKLRFLLLELNVLNMLEVSTANLQTEDYRNQIGNLIKNICNQILKSYDDKPLTWIGFFRDEEYDKIKYNQLHNTGQNNLFELVTS